MNQLSNFISHKIIKYILRIKLRTYITINQFHYVWKYQFLKEHFSESTYMYTVIQKIKDKSVFALRNCVFMFDLQLRKISSPLFGIWRSTYFCWKMEEHAKLQERAGVYHGHFRQFSSRTGGLRKWGSFTSWRKTEPPKA